MSVQPCADPYYVTEAARWVLRRVTGAGVEVEVVDDLRVPCYSSRAEGRVWVRAGLEFPQYHWSMARAIVHQLFGVQGEQSPPSVALDVNRVARDAVVVPFQRPPFTSGAWRR